MHHHLPSNKKVEHFFCLEDTNNGYHIRHTQSGKKKGLTLLFPFGKEEVLIALKIRVTINLIVFYHKYL